MQPSFQPSDLPGASKKLRRLTRSDITRIHARTFIRFLKAETAAQCDAHRQEHDGEEPAAYVVSFSDEQFSLACVNESLRLLRRQKNCQWNTVRYDGTRGRIVLSVQAGYITPEEKETEERYPTGRVLAVA